jgi:hypothetical protein
MSENNPVGLAEPGYTDVPLSRPIMVGGEKKTHLRLKEPTLAQAEFLDKIRFKIGQAGDYEFLNLGTTVTNAAVHLGGLTHNEALQIKSRDCIPIWVAVMGFLIASDQTGATPSQ